MTAIVLSVNSINSIASATVNLSRFSIRTSSASSATSWRSRAGLSEPVISLPTFPPQSRFKPDAASHTTKGNTDGQEPN